MKIKQVNLIESSEWDKFVSKVYERPYCLQQQEGCRDRETISLSVPDEEYDENMNDEFPLPTDDIMGVKFAAWLSRDPKEKFLDYYHEEISDFELSLWWLRNFYPDLQTVANDLYNRGLLVAGEYVINIDW